MRLPLTHPTLAELSDFAAHDISDDTTRAIATHLRACPRCQDSLRFVHRLNAPATQPPVAASDPLLTRILASRTAGERMLLPATVDSRVRPRRRAAWGIAAAAVLVLALARLLTPSDAIAAADRSTLTLNPTAPLAGSVVRVRYTPAPGQFIGQPTLRLRARIRTARDESYTVPASHLRVLGLLQRERNGVYYGVFTIPDSTVFATLAVERTDSAAVDDNAGQGWDLLVAASDGRPLFDALMQRANDMMGRSWEQGYASIRRATELYPDSVQGWTNREFFEDQLLRGAGGDSMRTRVGVTLDRLVARARLAPSLGYDAMGSIYYHEYSRARRPGATGADSAAWQYWWQRLRAEYPKHDQAAQRLAFWMDVRALGAARALDSLEHLYQYFGPSHTSQGRSITRVAADVAGTVGDPSTQRRWTERLHTSERDSALRVAVFLSKTPGFRTEGMQALRDLLHDDRLGALVVRPLGRNSAGHARRLADLRRTILGSLGRALAASGQPRAALDTLRLASDGGWDPELFRDLARSYAIAGDTLASLLMQARIAVDGRTAPAKRDSLLRVGEQRAGPARWATLVRDARTEMHARLLEQSVVRSIPPSAQLRTRGGKDVPLTRLINDRPSLVIFWSRQCGYAIDALPEIKRLVERLARVGTPVVFAIDEAPSAELDRALAEYEITWPVYFDVRVSLGNAMRNFGTPAFYVLDRAGRIRFTAVDEPSDVYGRLEAVAAEDAADR